MAIWHTDNITGNDTTGDGTALNPYKTIQKAVSEAANDDTIRVAGSGWSAVSGTVSSNTNVAATTVQTSVNLNSELSAGVSLISVKDPQFGDRKLIYKVTAVTGTTITTHVPMGLVPGTNYEIEKITTNYYATSTAAVTIENLSTTNTTLTGIKVEGGWTGGFTAQDGITVMTLTTANATANGGPGFLMASTQTGWSFNNFAFGAFASAFNAGSGNTVGLGSIWGVNTRIFGAIVSNSVTNIPGTPMKLYITVSTITGLSRAVSEGVPFTINELYVVDGGSSSFGINLSQANACIIENMYVKSISISTAGSASGGQLYSGNYTINNLTIGWATDTTNQVYVLFGENSAGKLINITSLGNTQFKFFGLAIPGASQAQWINTAINIDSITYLGGTSSASQGTRSITTSNWVKDSEGEKLLLAGYNPVFADPTVFDTGTNSLRVRKMYSAAQFATPIKQHYIPAGATGAITFTIRAKSSGTNTTKFAMQPSPGSPQQTTITVPYILAQEFTLTNDWADYTYTLASTNVIEMADGYATLSCVGEQAWSYDHVWIDSVTIS